VDALLHDIIELLIRVGPWIVFFVTAAETALFLGLLVPAEATVLVAAFMADLGYFDVSDVLLATLLGAFAGDQIGYALGRVHGRRAEVHAGRLGRLWRRHEARATLLFARRSILAVSMARFISFVRTLMPWFAGMTRMPYSRFLVYDIIGIVGWGVGSVAAGYLAGRSWQALASGLGVASAVIVIGIILVMGGMAVRARRRMRSLVRVALTGNIASGKSAVSEVWRRNGAVVIDADELARVAVEPGTPALARIRRAFGRAVIAADGTLDRAALRRAVFGDDRKRRRLEAILHPEIERLRREAERKAFDDGVRFVVHAIPLLFETRLHEQFEIVVLVDAPEDVRRERLMKTRGLSATEADAMIAAQMPAAAKRDRARYVIENTAGLRELEEEAERVWAGIEARGE
jgi:dephospho-CoA kinase